LLSNEFYGFSLENREPIRVPDGLGGEVVVRTLMSGNAKFREGTHTGMVLSGRAELEVDGESYPLRPGMYFVCPGTMMLRGQGASLVLTKHDDVGLFQLGGPIEARGRLRYIDGCTDSLILAPPRRGNPCLNHLHIPPYTRQSAHTHPSVRVGAIARGSGICRTESGIWPLREGMGWVIPTGVRHSFHTEGQALDVLAWHPDSDTGPTDEDHPMINRTIR